MTHFTKGRWQVVVTPCRTRLAILAGQHPVCMLGNAAHLNAYDVALIEQAAEMYLVLASLVQAVQQAPDFQVHAVDFDFTAPPSKEDQRLYDALDNAKALLSRIDNAPSIDERMIVAAAMRERADGAKGGGS